VNLKSMTRAAAPTTTKMTVSINHAKLFPF
jgi:hypothetical protein